MFLPSLFCESSVAFPFCSPGSLLQLLWILLTSRLYHLVVIETSLGKCTILLPIPAASTTNGVLVKGFAMLCLLTRQMQPRIPFLFVSTPDASGQSCFLHCMGCPRPACSLLNGSIFDSNLPLRDLHPLDKFIPVPGSVLNLNLYFSDFY